MLPILIRVIPLEHHLARRVRRVEVDVGEQGVARADGELVDRVLEEVLVIPRKDVRLVRGRAGERRRVGARPFPALVVAREVSPRGRAVFHPNFFGRRLTRSFARPVPRRATAVERERHAVHGVRPRQRLRRVPAEHILGRPEDARLIDEAAVTAVAHATLAALDEAGLAVDEVKVTRVRAAPAADPDVVVLRDGDVATMCAVTLV